MNRLFVKYLVPLLLISIVPLLASGITLFLLLQRDFNTLEQDQAELMSADLTKEISYKNEAIAKTEGLYVEQEIDRIGNKVSAMALSPDFTSQDIYGISAFVENLLASEPAILEITVVDKFGQRIFNKVNSFSLLSEDYIDLTENDIFRSLEQKESYISDVQISSRTQLPYITMGQPIVQMGGNFGGGIMLNLNLNFIWNIVADKQVGQNSILYIVAEDGQLISHPSTKELYQNSDYGKYDYIQEILHNKNGTLTKGKNLVSYYTNKYNWTTIIEIPTEEALASVEESRFNFHEFITNSLFSLALTTGLVIIVVLVLVAFTSVLIARRIVNPIVELTDATRKVADGDLSQSMPKKSNDELGELTESFNSMTEELRKNRDELVKSNEYVKKQAEELLDRYNSDLEQFAYVTTHDLIEPLRMITSYTQLLKRRYRDKLDGDAEEFMVYIVEGVERMHVIINDLFEYSHIRTNVSDFEQVDFLEVFEHVIHKLNKEITESGTTISYSNLPKTKAVYSNIVQLFQNLIANSIKFSKKDEPMKIDIQAEDLGEEWLLTFRDNGIGIDPIYKEKIFEIFKRLNKRDQYAGSGMGLAICKNIVERHGGKIWVKSELGLGATFYFTIKKY